MCFDWVTYFSDLKISPNNEIRENILLLRPNLVPVYYTFRLKDGGRAIMEYLPKSITMTGEGITVYYDRISDRIICKFV